MIKSAEAVLAPGPSMKKGQLDQTLLSQKKMLAKPEQFSGPVHLTATQAARSAYSAGALLGTQVANPLVTTPLEILLGLVF